MNKIILATAFATLIPLSSTVFADDSMPTKTNGNTGAVHSQMKNQATTKMLHDQMEADAARLNLTPEQKTKVAEIMKEHKKDLTKDIRDELDDTQKVEFDKIQAEHKAAWGKKTQ
jgi:hypothetical protein